MHANSSKVLGIFIEEVLGQTATLKTKRSFVQCILNCLLLDMFKFSVCVNLTYKKIARKESMFMLCLSDTQRSLGSVDTQSWVEFQCLVLNNFRFGSHKTRFETEAKVEKFSKSC